MESRKKKHLYFRLKIKQNNVNVSASTCLTSCFVSFMSSAVNVLEPVTARACPSARLPRCYRKKRFSENLSENEVSHRTMQRRDGECCPIRKILRPECPRVSQWAVHWVHVCANTHTKTCMDMFFRCIELSVCFPYGFYWSVSQLYPPPP